MTSIEILGCRVDAVGREAAIERVVALAHGTTPSIVVTLGTEMVMEAQHNLQFRAVIDGAALVVCDTIGLLLASRLRGGPLRERVTGVDLVQLLASRSHREKLRMFLLGGRAETSERASASLVANGAMVAGSHHGYFTSGDDASGDDASIVAQIRASGANVLLVGLGSPKQELWLAQHLAATGCSVGIGIGGTLDVLAGSVERAPEIWQKLGLEWCYRLVREPWRWRRQLALPAFFILALREAAQLCVSRGKTTG
ncbi:MAG TPA: WecB/TagA/CpsF family glycosyltransferase [Candidatus Baltobacteraceae bacterium]